MSAEHIAVTAGPVLGDGAVQVRLGVVVIPEPVPECRIRILVHNLVCGVAGECIGCQSYEFQRTDDPDVKRPSQGIGPVDGIGIVAVELPEYAESVFGHHFLLSAAVVVAEGEIGPVCCVAAVGIVHRFIRVCEIGIGKGVHAAVRRQGTLSCRIQSYVYLYEIGRSHRDVGRQVVSLVTVVDEHSVVIVVSHGDIIGIPVRTSAEAEVVVVGECIAEKHIVPVRVDALQGFYIVVLRRRISGHGSEFPYTGPYLSYNAYYREDYRVVGKRLFVFRCREFVPELLFPCQFLCRVHEAEIPLGTE